MSITQSKLGVTIDSPNSANLSCCCWAGIIIKPDTMYSVLYFMPENCTGYTWVWQNFDDGTWKNVQTGGNSYEWLLATAHRIKFSKEGCCDFYTEPYVTFLL